MKRLFVTLALLAVAMNLRADPIRDALDAEKRGDYAAAAVLMAQQAGTGNPAAMSHMGYFYALGRGVSKNYKMAHELWQKAAQKGDGAAMYGIGAMYETGEGALPKDAAQAAAWYLKGAEHGHPHSMMIMSSLYEKGESVPASANNAMAWALVVLMNGKKESFEALQPVAKDRVQLLREKYAKEQVHGSFAEAGRLNLLVKKNVEASGQP